MYREHFLCLIFVYRKYMNECTENSCKDKWFAMIVCCFCLWSVPDGLAERAGGSGMHACFVRLPVRPNLKFFKIPVTSNL